MYPLLNLVGGITLGALGVRMGKKHLPGASAKANAAMRGAASRVGGGLRGATATGLGAIEKGAGDLRQRIDVAPEYVAECDDQQKPKKRRAPRKVSAVKSRAAN